MMLKAMIPWLCSLCWRWRHNGMVKSGGDALEASKVSTSPISIQAMHSSAHRVGLPTRAFQAY